MVSISKIGEQANDRVLELVGLSTDVKPIGEIDGVRIVNVQHTLKWILVM